MTIVPVGSDGLECALKAFYSPWSITTSRTVLYGSGWEKVRFVSSPSTQIREIHEGGLEINLGYRIEKHAAVLLNCLRAFSGLGSRCVGFLEGYRSLDLSPQSVNREHYILDRVSKAVNLHVMSSSKAGEVPKSAVLQLLAPANEGYDTFLTAYPKLLTEEDWREYFLAALRLSSGTQAA